VDAQLDDAAGLARGDGNADVDRTVRIGSGLGSWYPLLANHAIARGEMTSTKPIATNHIPQTAFDASFQTEL